MLHWAEGAEGRGVVCAADIATVNMDRKSFTFMRSYPNFIPLSVGGRAQGIVRRAHALPVRPRLQPLLRPLHQLRRQADPAGPPSTATSPPSRAPMIEKGSMPAIKTQRGPSK